MTVRITNFDSGDDLPRAVYCSFCGKSQHEVGQMIAGPTVFICDACVARCVTLLEESGKTDVDQP
jgi:ATP-dependent Clp protease ATP-binding subunit ClpX